MALPSSRSIRAVGGPRGEPLEVLHSEGGRWRETAVVQGVYLFGAGIAFATQRVGWLHTAAGGEAGSVAAVYVTADGGRSWHGLELPEQLQRPTALYALNAG